MQNTAQALRDLALGPQHNRQVQISFPDDNAPYRILLPNAFEAVESLSKDFAYTSETIVKTPAHPLSAYLMKAWDVSTEGAEVGVKVGRVTGAGAGILLAGYDIFKNAPEAFENHQKKLGWLYIGSGSLGAYVAVATLFSWPLFWPALVLSIFIAIVIAVFKASALADWVSRCKFSKGEHYDSLEAELKAFTSAAGG